MIIDETLTKNNGSSFSALNFLQVILQQRNVVRSLKVHQCKMGFPSRKTLLSDQRRYPFPQMYSRGAEELHHNNKTTTHLRLIRMATVFPSCYDNDKTSIIKIHCPKMTQSRKEELSLKNQKHLLFKANMISDKAQSQRTNKSSIQVQLTTGKHSRTGNH